MPIESFAQSAVGFKRIASGETVCAALSVKNGAPKIDSLFVGNPQQVPSHVPVGALKSSSVLVRQLDLPVKKEKELDQVLPFQVEPLLPYPIEEGEIDRIVLKVEDGQTKITFLAVKQSEIEAFLGENENDPELLSVESVSIAQFAHHITQSPHPLIAIHIDEEYTTVTASILGKLIAAHTFDLGSDDMRSDSMRQNIHRSLLSLQKSAATPLMRQVVITSVKPLDSYTFLLPTTHSEWAVPNLEWQRYTVPIGSALSALTGSKGSVNFRKNSFAYPAPWKRLKNVLSTYFSLTVGASLALFLFGKGYLQNELRGLNEQFMEQLIFLNRDPKAFEARFQEKVLGLDPEVVNISSYSPDELNERIEFLQKEIQASPNLFALHPNVPRVSDLLAFLSTHPQISSEKGFKLISLAYQMTKRPDMGKKQERYQVKVDMEFTTNTPKQAREFHDALIAPNDFVDPKGDIKWSTGKGTYRTSFYLKDRTHYPT